ERFLHSDPPTHTQVQAAQAHIRQLLAEAKQHLQGAHPKTWLGLAGTVTAFAARAAGLSHYDATQTHGYALTPEHIHTFTRQLLNVATESRSRLLVEPKRAAVIIGGALVLSEIVDAFQLARVRTSEK